MTKMTQKNYEGIKIYRQKMKIFELKGLVQRLGNNVEDLTLQKDLLVVENNKLRGLLKECGRRIEDFIEERGYHYYEAEDLLARINAAFGESEGQ